MGNGWKCRMFRGFLLCFFVPKKSLLESNDHHDVVAGDDANLVKDEGVVMWWVPT